MDIKKAREILLQNPEFEKEYNSLDLPFEISKILIRARIKRGLSQKQLAEMLNTKQSGVARAESGKSFPTFSFLQRIAHALQMILLPPQLIPVEEMKIVTDTSSTNYQKRVAIVPVSEESIIPNSFSTRAKKARAVSIGVNFI